MLPKIVEHLVQNHVTNANVRRKIQAAIREYDEILTLIYSFMPFFLLLFFFRLEPFFSSFS